MRLSVRAKTTNDLLIQEGLVSSQSFARALVDGVHLLLGGGCDALVDRQGRLDAGLPSDRDAGGQFLARGHATAQDCVIGKVVSRHTHNVHDEHEGRVRGDVAAGLAAVAERSRNHQLDAVTHMRVRQSVGPTLHHLVEGELDSIATLERRIEDCAVPQGTDVVRLDRRAGAHDRTITLLEGLDEHLRGRL